MINRRPRGGYTSVSCITFETHLRMEMGNMSKRHVEYHLKNLIVISINL